jgi:SAM-dependent methyltransferase
MSIQPRRDPYLEPYRRSQRRHGTRFEVTCWASPDSQRRRFEVFAELVFLGGSCILDAGCSRGDFAAYLLEEEIPFTRYIGIDALGGVIEHARQRGLARCEFHVGDLLTEPRLLCLGRPDVICMSGTLNTMDDAHALALLESAWQAAGQALLFNFLSDRCGVRAPGQSGGCRRLDTLGIMNWALSWTWDVAFRQDYFADGHDATIAMRKAR